MIESVSDLIKLHEGTGPVIRRRMRVYDDADGHPIVSGVVVEGHPSIGYGRNLAGRGITVDEAAFLLANDLLDVAAGCRKYPWFDGLSKPRQAAIMDLYYNVGPTRFATFRRMIAALERADYETAAMEMLDSRWAEQVGVRAERDASMMVKGLWPVA